MTKYWHQRVEGEENLSVHFIKMVHRPEIYTQLRDKTTKKEKVWKKLYAELEAKGFTMISDTPWLKLREKYNNVQKAYFKHKRLKTTGKTFKNTPIYYDLMEQVHSKPKKVDLQILDTAEDDPEAPSNGGAPSSSLVEPCPSRSALNKHRRSQHEELIEFLKKYTEEVKLSKAEVLKTLKSQFEREYELKQKFLKVKEREAAQRGALIKLLFEKKNG